MKKFLSLVLALVMTMSLVTVSAGAKDFKDDGKITYDEAVAVMSEVKVLDGYADGSFNPQGELTRGAAAKIICNLMLGPTTAAELHADTAPYKDVPVNHTFAGYIAYCAKEGIISGYADGAFRPAAPLTGYAFMKMLLGALGYDAEIEGYTGANWSINVAKRALNIGLNNSLEGDFNGIKHVTREEAALYAFNTLQADLVEYDSRTSVNVGGAEVVIAGSEAKAQKWNNSATKIENIKKDNYIQFAEQYFTKLVLSDDVDAFGRPCRTWSYKNKDIGTYLNSDLMVAEYTTAVSGKDLYDVIDSAAFTKDYDFSSFVDGEKDDLWKDISKNNKADVANTADGALTQVFVDDDDEKTVVVTVINTYLAQATTDYNEKKDEASFTVYGISGTKKVSGEDFDVAEIEKDDFVLVCYSKDTEAIEIISDVEILSNVEISKFSTNGKATSVTVEGTKYNDSAKLVYDTEVLDEYAQVNLKDTTFNVYLDAYGYVIGIDIVDEPDNFVFITAGDANNSNLTSKPYTVNAIFMDGTSEVISVKKTNNIGDDLDEVLVNAWFTYSKDSKDVYTVKAVNYNGVGGTKYGQYQHDGVPSGKDIDSKHISLQGAASGTYSKVYGTDDTVYLQAELDNLTKDSSAYAVISGVDEVVTGIDNASFELYTTFADIRKEAGITGTAVNANLDATHNAFGAYPLYNDEGDIIAAVVVAESDSISSKYAFTVNEKVEEEGYADDVWTWTKKVIIGGEETILTEVDENGNDSVLEDQMSGRGTQYKWYEVDFDAKGNVKKVGAPSDLKTTLADVVTAIEADTDDLFPVSLTDDHVYSLKGKTLFDETVRKEGFRVAADVKVALIQTTKNKTNTDYFDGYEALESVLKDLNEDDDKKVNYQLHAIIEDGRATSVIVVDLNKDGYTRPEGSSGKDGTKTGTVVEDGLTLKVYVRQGEKLNVKSAVIDYFDGEYDNIKKSGSEYEVTVGKETYTTETITLGAVTLTNQYAANPGVQTTPDTVYLAEGQTVTVELYYENGVLTDQNVATLKIDSNNLEIKSAKLSSDKHTITVELTAEADFDTCTKTFSWS